MAETTMATIEHIRQTMPGLLPDHEGIPVLTPIDSGFLDRVSKASVAHTLVVTSAIDALLDEMNLPFRLI